MNTRGVKYDEAFIEREETIIETKYREPRGMRTGYYKDEVLEARSDGNGNLAFSYAKGDSYVKSAPSNRTSYVTFSLLAGALNGVSFNIDWSKVKSVSGKTYSIKEELKATGFKWHSDTKKWERD